MVPESVSAGNTQGIEEGALTEWVGGLLFSVLLDDDGRYRLGLLIGHRGNRHVRWFVLADDGIRAEAWRMLGHHVEVWSRHDIAQRVEMP